MLIFNPIVDTISNFDQHLIRCWIFTGKIFDVEFHSDGWLNVEFKFYNDFKLIRCQILQKNWLMLNFNQNLIRYRNPNETWCWSAMKYWNEMSLRWNGTVRIWISGGKSVKPYLTRTQVVFNFLFVFHFSWGL